MTPARLRTALVRLAILLAVAFVGDRVLSAGLARLTLMSQGRYSLLYRGGPPVDVVVVGDSRGVNGFYAPGLEKALGVKVENLSYSGLSMVLAEALFRDWVDHHGAPRMLVLEVSSVGRLSDGIDGLLPFLVDSERLRAIAQEEDPRSAAAIHLSHLYAYHGEQFLRTLYYLRRSDRDWINRYRVSASLVEETRHMDLLALPARPENLAALTRLVEFAHQRGIALRLVVTPYLKEYLDRVTNYDAWVEQVERAAGEPVWDDSRADEDVEHFADRVHLNAEGAQALIASFVRDGLFDASRPVPPHTHLSDSAP